MHHMEHLLPYIAGFFDGEGCISIQKHHGNGAYVLWVSITNTSPEPLRLMKEHWGGHFVLIRRHDPQSNIYRLYLSTRRAATFIEDVLPYLIIKKPQAELALEYVTHVDDCNRMYRHIKGKKGVQPLPPEVYVLRDVYMQRMREFNKRGRILEPERTGDYSVLLATGSSITE